MERTRTTLLLLLVVGLTSMTAAGAAAAPAQVPLATPAETSPAAATPATAVAGDTSCTDLLKCPSACSPLAGAWVARLRWPTDTVIQTFKFVPVNLECSTFAVNSQASTRPGKVIKFWPEACALTELVGTACAATWNDLQFTAIGYGVKRCATPGFDRIIIGTPGDTTTDGVKDEVLFIEVVTGRIKVPQGCGPCLQDENDSVRKESDELDVTIYVSYFDAAQDQDHDGLPDTCEPVLCQCFETKLKRVKLMEPCEASQSFVACLEACQENTKDVNTPATGRAFFAVHESEQEVCFVVTVKNLKNATKVVIQVSGTDVVTLFPFPPATKGKDGNCDGLLACGCFRVKDCASSWKNKKFGDIIKEIEQGKATVVVATRECPKGEICGSIQDD